MKKQVNYSFVLEGVKMDKALREGIMDLLAKIMAGHQVRVYVKGKDPKAKEFKKTFDDLVKNLKRANELEKEIAALKKAGKIYVKESIIKLEEIL